MPPEPRKKRIVVVDDEEVLRKMMRRLLERAGYEAVVLASSTEALALLLRDPEVDLVITDVRMPDLSGPELARRLLRRDPPAIVFMSGASDETPAALEALGGRAFIKKPFRVAEVLEVVERVIGRP
jgi:putative two-component system response regulator